MMKKNGLPIILGISIAIALGIVYAGLVIEEPIVVNTPIDASNNINQTTHGHLDAITSGPVTVTQYKHKIWDNIFIIVSGLEEGEKGNIRIFMPDGRLYKTLDYDGSVKDGFNSYFKPDTNLFRKICSQEEIAGIWTVKFDNNTYPPLEFEIINEHFDGPDVHLDTIC